MNVNEINGVAQEAMEFTPTIGADAIREAMHIMQKYRAGKASIERRVISAENWWKLRNWRETDPERAGEPVSAWLWNCITSKHADAMAAYPEPVVLPRMADDKQEAQKSLWCWSRTIFRTLTASACGKSCFRVRPFTAYFGTAPS